MKATLEGEVSNLAAWKNILEFCFKSTSIIKFMMSTWLAAMMFNILVELINYSLMLSVLIGIVSNTMVTSFLRSTSVSLSSFLLFCDLTLHYLIRRKVARKTV